TDVLIPGIMQHVERAGVHSGDSIAVYPPFSRDDAMMDTVVRSSDKLALALGTKGLVNIQYLVYHGELYVIEVNPRASRTIPYISKVTNVPMVDIASRVMTGQALKDLGYGTGLYKTPPYCAVKVPVFSFEKLNDANSYLGPEMKSTGEVLGIGKDLSEALFKGLVSSGIQLPHPGAKAGVLLSVDAYDYREVVDVARRFSDLGCEIHATEGTAQTIATLGIPVKKIPGIRESDHAFELLESGKINYIIYTGALRDSSLEAYLALHRRAQLLGIACFTSLDTARALADIMLSRYSQQNTELVDINHMRQSHGTLHFVKMQATGNDYIIIDNTDGDIACPESLAVRLCEQHYGVGAEGMTLIEKSDVADAKMRQYNRDGTEGFTGGNALRCVGKYLYDRGVMVGRDITVETASGIARLHLFTRYGKVSSVAVDMGPASFNPADVPCTLPGDRAVNVKAAIGGEEYTVTCVSMGNPHCVVFTEHVDWLNLKTLGPTFENAPLFPERVNAEFVRVVNPTTLRMRCFERGSGETMACGTGACAAAAAAVANGYSPKDTDILVQVPGGKLWVRYTDDTVVLTGKVQQVFEAETEY
ncbi:MAG: diaminopimelate epimerase, partial [Clostridia bacterium]|nr:diaminopimelate epimerase [Clostridia bacterium]